ncbi:MFS transporter [Saccharopolyspora sp. TS4A08]|uniref:MFS transporter n=1 Tax=Saccharopolyspora ipomoeae TaxID=3042027 RepID=A0ABT6PI71_9PSEU|nr:MFS transporter [Saccharopolyspora sp. TS4A08]MDI2027695.1 MFS transporter [Saccharopolyspora sp. TS4A08]
MSIGNRQVWTLLGHAALTQLITFVLRPATTYRALELGVPASWLGVLSGSFALVPLVLALPAGHIVDRLGERRVMFAGSLLMCAAGTLLLALGHTVPGLIAGSVVLGTAHLGAIVGQQALVANSATSGRMDSAFGYYTFAASLGQAAGPLMIVAFGGTQAIPDTTPIFAGSIAIAVALFAITFAVRSTSTERGPAATENIGVRQLLRIPGLAGALLTACTVLAAVDISLVYLPALGAERGIASSLIGTLLVLRAASSMASRFFLGRLSEVLGRRRLLILSIVAASIGLVVAAAPVPVWLLLIAVTVAGFGLGVGQPVTMSWLAESAPPGARGRAMSLRLTGNRAGQVVIPGAIGLVAAGLGSAGVLWVTAGGLALTGLLARNLPVNRT